MSIKVKGIPIRNEELSYDMEIPFSNLTVKGQERMFLENKDIFICEAFTSKYDTVRQLAHENMSECSSENLNKVILSLYGIYTNVDIILEILSIPNFVLEDDVREKLIKSTYWEFPLYIAYKADTPYEVLCDILINSALKDAFWNGSLSLFEAVINNPNFQKSLEIENLISNFYSILSLPSHSSLESNYLQLKSNFERAIKDTK